MMQVLVVVLAVVMGGFCIIQSPTVAVVVWALLALLFALAGLAFKRYGYVMIASAAALVNGLNVLLSGSKQPGIWGASAYGILLFLLLEVGYDAVVIVRQRIHLKSYGPRTRYLIGASVAALLFVFGFVTAGYNLAFHFPSLVRLPLTLPAMYIGMAAVGGAIAYALRRHRRLQGRNAESVSSAPARR